MKCTRCAAEIPGQAQFCMRCGTPVAVGRPGGPALAAQPAGITYASHAPSRPKWPAILAAVVVLAAIAALVALKLRPGKVSEAQANALGTGALTDTGGRVHDTGPLASDKSTAQPGPADPVDIIDYLKHVKETERRRLALMQSETAKVLELSSTMQADSATTYMDPNGDWSHQKSYSGMQNDLSKWSGEWQELSKQFLAYPKPVPASCTALRDKYLDALGKTEASMVQIGSSFSSALSGNPGSALQVLEQMRGSTTRAGGIDEACNKADEEVAAVCDKYRIHKDFDIKPDGGAQNPFGIGR